KKYRAYSLGMRQRLAIAGTLLAPRELLVLDEPTNGLDPQGTREVRHLIASLADDGATVLVSSHLLSEVEQVCTHIGVMHVGRLLTQGPIAEVRAVSEPRARVETDRPEDAARVLRNLGLTDVAVESGVVVGTLGALAPDKVVAALVGDGVPVTGFAAERPSLEDLFVSLTGEGFNVSG
ncbi:MAG: AAA family ATPase, partial [Dermatophilaceae bacterium]